MIKKIGVYSGIFFGAALIGGGIATGILLPKTLKVKKKLENFVANGGNYNSLSDKNKINIVTIGDSESAGYVGYLGRDDRSYADFLAKSFQNAGRLGKYHNFAKSGERLADIKKDVFEDAYIMRQITGQKDKDGNKIKGTGADLITVTIGVNDILAYLRFLHISFTDFLNGFLKSDKPDVIPKYNRPGILKDFKNSDNIIRQKVDFLKDDVAASKQWDNLMTQSSESRSSVSQLADIERTTIFGNDPGLNMSKIDSYNEFEDSINDLKNMIVGKNQSLLNLDKDWFPEVYDLVKREMSVLVRDLHEANPDAQIIILGHAFPFVQLNEDVKNNKKPELDNTSLKENFSRLLDSMEQGAKKNIDDNNNKFVSFYKVDEFAKFKDSLKTLDFSDLTKFRKSVIGNVMPNITDVYQSVLGYDKIGESLYDIYGKEAGIKNLETTTQHSYPAGTEDNPATTNIHENMWARNDELYVESNNSNQKIWTKRYDEAKTLSQISDIGSSLEGKMSVVILPLLNELLSKNNNIKMTNLTAKMMTTLEKLINKDDVLSKIPSIKTLLETFITSLFNNLQDVSNIVGAVRTELKNGLDDDGVTEIKMFKLSQWGLYELFKKILRIQVQLKNALSNPDISQFIK